MATSTLVQFLAAGQSVETSNKRQVETFKADGAIAAGAPVMFDLAESDDGDKMLKVVESAADAACIGVALAAASAKTKAMSALSALR